MASRRRPRDRAGEFDDLQPVEPDAALRRRVLASLEPDARFEGFGGRFAELFDVSPDRAQEILRGADDPSRGAWADAPVPGVRLLHFQGGEKVAAADCGLVHLAPHAAFPPHRHGGAEWAFVLSGRAEEDSGEVWLPGDLVIRETGSVHGFRALGEEPYLFAVVLHGGIEITGS